MNKALKLVLGIGATVVGLIAVLLFIATCSPGVKQGSHVARVDWLPAEATDITYSRRGGFGWYLVYKCTLPETNFIQLAEREGWQTRTATNVAVPGQRLMLNLPPLTNSSGLPVRIERAFVFEQRQSNNGGTTVVYDRDRSRLFVCQSHR